jgi:hypothetical protein
MLKLNPNSVPLANGPASVGYAWAEAATDRDCVAAAQPETGHESRSIREIPASADVAQLVEHFTRNEGVRGSSPRVGLRKAPQMARFS